MNAVEKLSDTKCFQGRLLQIHCKRHIWTYKDNKEEFIDFLAGRIPIDFLLSQQLTKAFR